MKCVLLQFNPIDPLPFNISTKSLLSFSFSAKASHKAVWSGPLTLSVTGTHGAGLRPFTHRLPECDLTQMAAPCSSLGTSTPPTSSSTGPGQDRCFLLLPHTQPWMNPSFCQTSTSEELFVCARQMSKMWKKKTNYNVCSKHIGRILICSWHSTLKN